MTFRPGQGWGWRAGRLIWVIACRRAVLLNGIALPGCAATVPTACYGWDLTCWAMPAGWRRLGLAQWEKVRPGYPRSGPAGFGRGRARQAPRLSTLTGAANGRLRPASWPPVDVC